MRTLMFLESFGAAAPNFPGSAFCKNDAGYVSSHSVEEVMLSEIESAPVRVALVESTR